MTFEEWWESAGIFDRHIAAAEQAYKARDNEITKLNRIIAQQAASIEALIEESSN